MLLIASQSCPGLETDWQHTSSSLSDADTTNSLASHSFAFRRVIHFIIWNCCWHIWDLYLRGRALLCTGRPNLAKVLHDRENGRRPFEGSWHYGWELCWPCDHGGAGLQGAFRAFTFSDSKCLQSASRSYSHEILAIRTQILSMLMDLSQLGIQCWPNLNWFHLRLATRPGSRLLIVNSLSKHLAHPFLLPAAHKIVNCLGKQAVGNLGVERHKSQRENYGTLLYYVHGQMGSTKY